MSLTIALAILAIVGWVYALINLALAKRAIDGWGVALDEWGETLRHNDALISLLEEERDL